MGVGKTNDEYVLFYSLLYDKLSQKQRHELLVDLEPDDGRRDHRHNDEGGAAAREGGRRHGHRAGRVPLLPRHRRGDDAEEREDAEGAWSG